MARYDDENDEKSLVDQKYALTSYLDSLFRDMPAIEADLSADEKCEPVVEVVAEPEPEPAKPSAPEILPQEPPSRIVEQKLIETVINVTESWEEAPQVPQQVSPREVESISDDSAQIEHYHATEEFQVLFFQIGKLNLAVPLEHLSGVLKVADEKVIPIPGYAPWHMGLMKYHESTVNIVDTAKLIVPSHRKEIVEDRRQYRYFILLDERRWGLGCHSVTDVVTLQPAEVKWRGNRTLQPWLAGTIIEKMCALLDVEGFLRMLHQQRATKL